MIRLKDFIATVDRTELYIYAIEGDQYKTLAMPSVRTGITEYHKECEKLRALENADEYIVKRVGMIERSRDDSSCIYVECEKEVR